MGRWWRRGEKSGPEAMVEAEDPVETNVVPTEVLTVIGTMVAELGDDLRTRMDHLALRIEALSLEMEKIAPPSYEMPDEAEGSDTPDQEYARYLRYFVLDGNVSKVTGDIVEVRVIGRLMDGTYAWVNEEWRVCGIVTSEQLSGGTPFPDDTFRARVVSHSWGHVVESVMPNSLRNPLETRVRREPSADWGREAAEEFLGGAPWWIRSLRPGDVLIARIPYDGPMPIDRLGRRGKERPSVFMRWEGEYAILRACYDVKSFVGEKGLGHRSTDSGCFTKPSVIRYAEFDTKVENLRRRLGRLGPRDLRELNIIEVPNPTSDHTTANESTSNSLRAPLTEALIAGADRFVQDARRDILLSVEVEATRRARSSSTRDMAAALLEVLVERSDSRDLLSSSGLKFAMLGEALQRVAERLETRIPKGEFAENMREVVGSFRSTNGWLPYIESDEHGYDVLRVESRANLSGTTKAETHDEPVPLDRGATWVDFENMRFYMEADYLEPDLIVMDQEASARILGDCRVDLRAELSALRMSGSCRGVIVGSDVEPARASFVRAAKQRGWEFAEATDESARIDVTLDLCREVGARTITLITLNTELIAEVENIGIDVNVICRLEDEELG